MDSRVRTSRTSPLPLALALCLSLASSLAHAQSWRDDVVFYAPMDGQADAARAKGAPQAKLHGPTRFVVGRRGQALSLPSGAGCSYAAAGNFTREQGTFCAWVCLERDTALWDPGAGSRYQWLLGLRDAPAVPDDRNDLRLFFDRSFTLQYATPQPGRLSGMAAVPDLRWAAGTWHHVGVTYQSRRLQLYVDGEPREQALTVYEPMSALGDRLLLGCSDEGGHGSLGGLVDEFYLLSRPVTNAEMRTIYLATGALAADSGGVQLPEPLFAATLDGSTAARCAGTGLREAQGLGLEFANWQRGKALLVQRRAYDMKASCTWADLPGPLPVRGTAMLWLKPAGPKPWDGNERGVRRPLLSLRTGGTRLELYRSAQQQLVFAAVGNAPGQTACDIVRWTATEAHHVAATWDSEGGALGLFVDGRQIATSALPGVLGTGAAPFAVWLGADDADRYAGDVADAAFRDLRLYDTILTEDQISAVATGREGTAQKPLGLADLPVAAQPPTWSAEFAGSGLQRGIVEYVRPSRAAEGPRLATADTAAARFVTSEAPAGPGTLALWFRVPGRSSMSTTTRVLSVRFVDPDGACLSFEDDALSQRLTPVMTDGEGFFGGSPSVYRLCDDAWHQAVITCGADRTELYLDGVRQQSGEGLRLGGVGEVTVGGDPSGLAEVIRWSRPLSGAEVAALANYGAAGLDTPAAATEAEGPYWDTGTAYRDEQGGMSRLCLNGRWRFCPVDGVTAAPPGGPPRGYGRLPGSFSAVHLWKLYDPAMKLIPGEDWLDGHGFTRYTPTRYDAGWYERFVTVPPEWRGRRISLRFDHLAGYVARVCVDGQLRGHWEQTRPGEALLYPPRSVDISDCAGRTIRVSLLLGWDNEGAGDFLAVGDSWLVAEDGWVDIQSVMPVTKLVPEKALTVRVVLTNGGSAPARVSVEARVLDDGRQALSLTEEAVTLAAGETREVVLSGTWPQAHLWSPDDPYLYQLTTTVRDASGRQLKEHTQRLGFREFGIRGRDFVLNGRPIHLRGTNTNLPYAYPITGPEYLRGMYETRKRLGYNTIQYWADPSVAAMGGQSWALEQMMDWCDEMGFIAVTGNVSHLQEVKDEAAYAATVDSFVRRYGAHAAVCMWFVNPNTCWYNYGMHPGNLDCGYGPAEGEPGFANHGLALVAEQTVRGHDPQGRPVFTYASGNFGAIYSAMQYMSLGLPLQEEADWPSRWAEAAPRPLMPVETDLKWTPHWADFEAYERAWQDRSALPMYYVEHAARYLGDEPYLQVDHPGVESLGFPQPNGDTEWNRLEAEPYALKTRALAAREILRGWRGYGMSGVTFHAEEDDLVQTWSRQAEVFPPRTPAELQTPGAKPELKYQWFPRYQDFTKLNQPFFDAFARDFGPLTAFIGGTTLEAERTEGEFTSADHGYTCGERVRKLMVVINDRTDRDLAATGDWRLRDAAGQVVAEGTSPVAALSGEVVKLPFEFVAPEVAGKTDYRLEFVLRQGEETLAQDALALQVYPRPAAERSAPVIVLVDGADGATAAALQAAGLAFQRADGPAALAGARAIVVGQGALAGAAASWLAEWERAGGLASGANVLVLAQPPVPLLNLIFEPTYERYVWPRDRSHAVLQGVGAEELANWRGASPLAPAYAPPDPDGKSAPHYPGLKWHWGNRGIVSTYPLRKPTYGSFRVLADDGFDLALSPLIEWLAGPSRIVLCQLDAVGRTGEDPVAAQLLRRLVAYVATAPQPRWRAASYTGSEAGRAYLAPHNLQDSARVPEDGVLVSDGAGEGTATRLQGHLERGGTVLLVNPSVAALQALGLEAREEGVWHAVLPAEAWPALAGVSPADLYWRGERTVPVLTNLPAGARATVPAVVAEVPRGRGRLVVWTMSAGRYDDWRATYVNSRFGTARSYYARTSNPDKIHRALSQVLTNLGVAQQPGQRTVFGGDTGQNGRTLSPLYRIALPRWKFRTDPDDEGLAQGWAGPELADAAWRDLTAPGMWQDQGVNDPHPGFLVEDPAMQRDYNGVAWYRVGVTIPEAMRGRDVYFDSGGIDDYDETFVNGVSIGRTGKETPAWWAVARHYRIAPELIRFGAVNVIAVRVTDTGGGGGFAGQEPPRLVAQPAGAPWSPYLADLSDYDINAFHNW